MTTNVVNPLTAQAIADSEANDVEAIDSTDFLFHVDSDAFANAPAWARAKAMSRSGIWYWFQNVPTWYDSIGAWAAPGRSWYVDDAPRGDGETAQFSLVVKGLPL